MTKAEEREYIIKKIENIKKQLELTENPEEYNTLTLFLYDIKSTLYMLCHREECGLAPLKIEDD